MKDSGFASYPSLKGRVVAVTGGATGIGESIVSHFARQGARVSFLDIQDEPAERLVELLAAEGLCAPQYLRCDLTDVGALRKAVGQILAGGDAVDVLVNNAGNDQRYAL